MSAARTEADPAPSAARRAPARRRWRFWIALAAVGVLIAPWAWRALAARESAAAPHGAPALPVRTAPAQLQDIELRIDALGTVQPLQTVNLHARVDGLLQRVDFQEGQRVRAGALLAEIDARPFDVQVAQAQGQLQRDQAQLANARADLSRYQELVATESAPRQQLDTQRALVAADEGLVASDQATLANAKLQQSFTRITAPIDGVIGLRQVDAGNNVHASDSAPLAVITQTQPISVVFSIPQDRLPAVLRRLHAGASLAATAYDRDGSTELARGELMASDNQIDTGTGTVKLKARFDNADQRLFPNQFVNVSLAVEQLTGAVTVPQAAVQRTAQGSSVFVVDAQDHAALRAVTLGAVDRGRVAVSSGVLAGEQVVIDGADRLRDGSRVERAGADTADAAASAASAPPRGRRHRAADAAPT